MLLVKTEGIYHSLQGRLETVSLKELAVNYPKMFKSCFVLLYNYRAKVDLYTLEKHPYTNYYIFRAKENLQEKQPHKDYYIGSNTYCRQADLTSYKEITPQSISEYYHNFYGIELTNKKIGNTVSDLFKSKFLEIEMDNAKIRKDFKLRHEIDIQGYR